MLRGYGGKAPINQGPSGPVYLASLKLAKKVCPEGAAEGVQGGPERPPWLSLYTRAHFYNNYIRVRGLFWLQFLIKWYLVARLGVPSFTANKIDSKIRSKISLD